MENNLIPFSKLKEIINNVKTEEIVQYEGSVGTRTSVVGSPYQVVELTLLYSAEENENEKADD